MASIFPGISVDSAPRETPDDEVGRVAILERILEEQKTYQIFPIDGFQGQRQWKIHRGNTFLNQTEFVAQIPPSTAWSREQNLLFGKKTSTRDNQGTNPALTPPTELSFMLHSYVEFPGKDKWEVKPIEPIAIPEGVPIRLFFWVYSENVDATAHLVLEQSKSKEIPIPLGSFKFEGWRRLEIPVHIPAKNIRMVQSLQIPLKVKSLRISSSPFQTKGSFFLYWSSLAMLLETSAVHYPGAEIKDNWGD